MSSPKAGRPNEPKSKPPKQAPRFLTVEFIADDLGVCQKTVCKWRAALGVFRTNAEGSRRLIHQSAVNGLNARRNGTAGEVRLWTVAELDLLRNLPDAEVRCRTDRTCHAVRMMRRQQGLPALRGAAEKAVAEGEEYRWQQ